MPLHFVRRFLAVTFLSLLCAIVAPCAPGKIPPFERDTKGVTVRSAGGVLRIDVCSDRIIHVIASPTQEIPAAIVPTAIDPCKGTTFKVGASGAAITIDTGAVQVRVDRAASAIHFLSADGSEILGEPANGGRVLHAKEINGTHTYDVQQEFLLSPDEALYGLGQHQEGFFNLRDIPLRLQQANTNISIPFLLSTKGYGVFWNNPSLTDFNPADQPVTLRPGTGEGTFRTGAAGEYGFLLSGNRTSKLRLAVNGQTIVDLENMWVPDSVGAKTYLQANTEYKVSAQTGGGTTLSVRAPSNTMSFRSEAGQAVDYYFIYGPDLNSVIAGYRKETGEVPMLPRWAFGFWQCRERYSSQQQILDTAAEFRKRKIPVDVMVQDWQYWGKYGWNAMKFDESYYPDPAQMMTELHRQDLHLSISVWAKFGAETDVNQDMGKEHLLLPVEAATGEPGEAKAKENWADLFNPRAGKLFWSEMNRELFHDGLDSWWLDASEPEGDPLKGVRTFLGPGELVRNAFPFYETGAVYEGQRAASQEKRVVILTRSAYAGQQRFGTISWSGDISANWETLRRQIPAGLSFGMSGFPYWTTDIGGFFRPEDQYTSKAYRELLVRWFEFGAFSPIFRVHGYKSETEMWKYGPEVERILIEYDKLRYRLLPYIYSEAWNVTSSGATLMRALPLEFPNDQKLRDVDDEFLFGPSLLINPVTQEGATQRQVKLPGNGDWVDFWTGRSLRGDQTVQANAELDRIPIYVRQGSIVPLGPDVQSAAEADDPLEVRVYGGRDADFVLYEDKGDGYAYERGEKAIIPMHWDDGRKTLVIGERKGEFPGLRKERTFRIVRVQEGIGAGAQTEGNADREVKYDGHRLAIDLSKAR